MKRSLHRQKGAVVVETAIILPLFIIILIGVLEFGIVFHNYLILQNASREGARFGAVGHPQTEIEERVREFAFHLDTPSLGILVVNAEGARGSTLEVHATYPLPLITPLMQTLTGNASFTLTADSFARLE